MFIDNSADSSIPIVNKVVKTLFEFFEKTSNIKINAIYIFLYCFCFLLLTINAIIDLNGVYKNITDNYAAVGLIMNFSELFFLSICFIVLSFYNGKEWLIFGSICSILSLCINIVGLLNDIYRLINSTKLSLPILIYPYELYSDLMLIFISFYFMFKLSVRTYYESIFGMNAILSSFSLSYLIVNLMMDFFNKTTIMLWYLWPICGNIVYIAITLFNIFVFFTY